MCRQDGRSVRNVGRTVNTCTYTLLLPSLLRGLWRTWDAFYNCLRRYRRRKNGHWRHRGAAEKRAPPAAAPFGRSLLQRLNSRRSAICAAGRWAAVPAGWLNVTATVPEQTLVHWRTGAAHLLFWPSFAEQRLAGRGTACAAQRLAGLPVTACKTFAAAWRSEHLAVFCCLAASSLLLPSRIAAPRLSGCLRL